MTDAVEPRVVVAEPIIRIEHVWKSFGTLEVLTERAGLSVVEVQAA